MSVVSPNMNHNILPDITRPGVTNVPMNDSCTCLDEFQRGEKLILAKCKHAFHRQCIEPWVNGQGNKSCPFCRRMITISPDLYTSLKNRISNAYKAAFSNCKNLICSDGVRGIAFFFLGVVLGEVINLIIACVTRIFINLPLIEVASSMSLFTVHLILNPSLLFYISFGIVTISVFILTYLTIYHFVRSLCKDRITIHQSRQFEADVITYVPIQA